MKKRNMVFILSFSVIILLVISFINIGLDIARTNTINNTVESLKITSQIDKEIVESRLDSDIKDIKELSEDLTQYNTTFDQVSFISDEIENYNFSRICIVPVGELSEEQNSKDYYNGKSFVVDKITGLSQNEPFSIIDREYYKKALEGKSSAVLITDSNFDGSTVFIFASPIFSTNINNESYVSSLVYGVLDRSELTSLIRTDFSSKNESINLLASADGTTLTAFSKELNENTTVNIFTYLEDCIVNDSQTTFNVSSGSIGGTDGDIRYYDINKKVDVYAKYNKLEFGLASNDFYSSKDIYVITLTDSKNIDEIFSGTKGAVLFVGYMISIIFFAQAVLFMVMLLKSKKEVRETKNNNIRKNKELFIALRKADSTIFEYELYNNVFRLLNNALANVNFPTEIPKPTKNAILLKYISKHRMVDFLNNCYKLTLNNDTHQEIFRVENGFNGLTYYLVSSTAIFDENNDIFKFIGSIKNITESELIRQKSDYEKILRNTILHEAEYSISANVSTDKVFGPNIIMGKYIEDLNITGFEDLKNKMLTEKDLLDYAVKIKQFLSKENILANYIAKKRNFSLEFEILENGDKYWKKITAILTQENHSTDIIALIAIYDINEAKQRDLVLQDKARHDHLTGLLNRYSGEIEFGIQLSEHPRSKFFIIDIDFFKTQNDTYGHQFGDTVIVDFSKRLNSLFSQRGKVARIGGDEFVALITDELSTEEFREFLELVNDYMTLVYNKDGNKNIVTCSFGVESSTEETNTFEELYRRADQKLYMAKAKGKNTYIL